MARNWTNDGTIRNDTTRLEGDRGRRDKKTKTRNDTSAREGKGRMRKERKEASARLARV